MSQPTSLVKRYVKGLVNAGFLTSNQVVVTNASNSLVTSGISSSILTFLSNISADVQTQLNARYSSLGGTIDGNVGIGTTAVTQLHVLGDILATGSLTASNLTILGDTVTLNTVTSNTEQLAVVNDGTGPALQVVQTGADIVAAFYDDSTLAFLIADGGNVGVRTSSPAYPFDVNGTVRATSFTGDGSGLSNINANLISTGTLSTNLLPLSGVNANTYGGPSQLPIITVDARGRVTNVATSNLVQSQWVSEGASISFTGGSVGIGTTNMAYKLHVDGNAFATELNTTVLFTHAANETSDERQKYNIQTIQEPTAIVSALRGVRFLWKDTDRADMGLIAQEVESVLPELVSINMHGVKAVAYGHLTGLLIEAVKEQQHTIDHMKREIEELKAALIG
jgi:hypothetical protein